MKNMATGRHARGWAAATMMIASFGLVGFSSATGPTAVLEGVTHAMNISSSKLACSYALPRQRELCRTSFASAHWRMTGSVKLGHVVVHGNEAIGTVVGHICEYEYGAKVCGTNTDPNRGLPSRKSTFAATFAADNGDSGSISPRQASFWTTSVVKQSGKWYFFPGF